MTYQNDRNRSDLDRGLDPANRRAREGWGMGSVILGSLAVLAVIFGLFFVFGERTSTVSTNANRPAATTPATTTGSGAATQNPDATGKPVMPGQVPAPASPPAGNR